MGNPFKLFGIIALASVLAAGLVTWLVTAQPARDALGTLPPPVSEPAPPPEPPPQAEPTAAQEADPLNKPAPKLELPGLEKGRFSLASYRGKSPVILFFFATW